MKTTIKSPLLRKAKEQKKQIEDLNKHCLSLSLQVAKLQANITFKDVQLEQYKQSEIILDDHLRAISCEIH